MPILTKDKSVDENTLQKNKFKKSGLSTMAFTAKILSWRFRHLNIVGCLLKRRPTKGGSWAPQDPPPPSYAPRKSKSTKRIFSGGGQNSLLSLLLGDPCSKEEKK